MSVQPKILQIMPPRPGWLAVYVHSEADDKEYGGEAWHALPLECLALIEQEGGGRTSTRVVGLVMQEYATGSFSFVSPDDDAFLSYERIDDTRDWQEAALKQRADVEEQRTERRKEWPRKRAQQLN